MLQHLELDRALVAEMDAQIHEIEAEISKFQVEEQLTALKDSISVLHASKELAQQRLDSYQYPVLTLPNEIIAEIFLHFLPTYPEPPPFFGKLSPTTLTHICHQWRETALATPALWRAIRIDHKTWKLSGEEAVSLSTARLKRSGSLPLSVRASDWYQGSPFAPSLALHRERWEHTKFSLKAASLSSVLDGPMPLLRTLWFLLLGPVTLRPFTVQSDNVPLLRSVILADYGARIIRLPWSQLTSLKLSPVTLTPCVSILRQTTCLVDLTLNLSKISNDDGPAYPDLILPHLENLAFEPRSGLHLGFFRSLVVPALLGLKLPEMFLARVSCPDRIHVGRLNSFISKSGCTLNELRISSASVHTEMAYRDAFPSIPLVHCDA
ncbi:F-box domain-containing protein [Favolaschia claudopus]|uniref:F-box domain-containing protein n=1 Tax=Favolaschia claudopus TaxID=2862362 RepID=A0AAW0DH37_9AGAR